MENLLIGKAGKNVWLHPDIVGVETSNLHPLTKNLAEQFNLNRKKARIWSLEVKVKITKISDVRNYFFQVVANCSWANFGYLAVWKIEDDTKTRKVMKELRMLTNLYGIGVIMINDETPEESSIIIPARERSRIDHVVCDRLIKENNEDLLNL